MRQAGRVLGLLVLGGTLGWGQVATPQPGSEIIYVDSVGIKPPTLIHAEPAVIPAGVSLGGEKHLCALNVVVKADGELKAIEVVGTSGPLEEAAIAAVRRSRFAPGTLDGKPVAVQTFVWVPFVDADHAAIPVAGPLNMVPGVVVPRALNLVEAEFSDAARRKHFSGELTIEVMVTKEGLPVNPHAVTALGMGLDEQALKAVRKYRFSPATLDGVPVAVPIRVEVRFGYY